MNVIAKIVVAEPRCSLVRNPNLHYPHTSNTFQVTSLGLYRHSLHMISLLLLSLRHQLSHTDSYLKSMSGCAIFIGSGGGREGVEVVHPLQLTKFVRSLFSL